MKGYKASGMSRRKTTRAKEERKRRRRRRRVEWKPLGIAIDKQLK
jgi:hypothetical protein